MENITGIYCIENLKNNKKYIGQSRNILYRWYRHKYELRIGMHRNEVLQHAWNKYGEENFIFYILETCEIYQLDEYEIYYIDVLHTYCRDFGYNLTSGGQNGSYPTDEVKKKISTILTGHVVSETTKQKIKENHYDCSGKNNSMYGKHHTNQTKQKISDANKGQIAHNRNRTPVYCYEYDMEYDDAFTASQILNLDSCGILKCCQGKRKTTFGLHWKFVDNNG